MKKIKIKKPKVKTQTIDHKKLYENYTPIKLIYRKEVIPLLKKDYILVKKEGDMFVSVEDRMKISMNTFKSIEMWIELFDVADDGWEVYRRKGSKRIIEY